MTDAPGNVFCWSEFQLLHVRELEAWEQASVGLLIYQSCSLSVGREIYFQVSLILMFYLHTFQTREKLQAQNSEYLYTFPRR